LDPTGATVEITGAGAQQGMADLADETNLTLTTDKQGNLQSEDFVGPRTQDQQLVEGAIASSATVSLNFENGNDSYNFGTTDGNGTHGIDVADTATLNTANNGSSFTAGGVVLHELAEGLGEVDPSVTGGQTAHGFANTYAPGLLSLPGYTALGAANPAQGVRYDSLVQDGSGTILNVTMGLRPPVNYPFPKGFSPRGPVVSVKSTP